MGIKDVKEMVYKLHGEIMPIESQDLWWKGYKLSRDDLTLQRACIGVNGEKLDETPESLKIFVIVRDIMHNKTKDKSYNERSSSFDLEYYWSEIRHQSKDYCAIM